MRIRLSVSLLALVAASGCREPAATWREPLTGMEFVRLPAGEFLMGSSADEPGREPGERQHRVVLSHSFYLGRYEVRQAEWQRVMGENPSAFSSCGPNCPVEQVSELQIQAFIERLQTLSSERFRLPTEAEWEYACRAGTTTPFNTGNNLTTEQANYDGEAPYPGLPAGAFRRTTTPVGFFPANAWGLFDLHGNVWE